MIYPPTGAPFFTIALGCFVDDAFPPPSTEFFTQFRHPWVASFQGVAQLADTRWEQTRAGLASVGSQRLNG